MRKASVAGLVSSRGRARSCARGGARRGAVEHDERGSGGEVGVTVKTIRVAVVATSTIRSRRRAGGHRRGRPGMGQVRERQRWDRRPQGQGRLHRSKLNPNTLATRSSRRARKTSRWSAPARCCSRPPMTGHELPGLGGQGDGNPRRRRPRDQHGEACAPTGIPSRRLRWNVARVTDTPQTYRDELRRLEVLREEQQGPARFVRAGQRLAVGRAHVEILNQAAQSAGIKSDSTGTSPPFTRRASTRRSSRR